MVHNKIKRATAVLAVAATLTGAGVAPAVAAPQAAGSVQAAQSDDIRDRLEQIDGLTVVSEEAEPAPGLRFFYLTYEQPVDHNDPSAGTFKQRFSLLHRSTNRPMILHTTGYNMPEQAFRSEPTKLVDGNQISVEQRFFEPSRPEPADWKKLNIAQAAADHHRIVVALKSIYEKPWLSTGASKGGMTSVYHRRYFPQDVAGVVAYVAPNDADNKADAAYDKFFANVGSDDGKCQKSLEALQKEALNRRSEFVKKYEKYAKQEGLEFDKVFGTADKAFEMMVLDVAWAFWQYAKQADCGEVPSTKASTQEIWDFFDATLGWAGYDDNAIGAYTPYYYQAATQLGWPSLKFKHLKGKLKYPGLYQANSSLPKELRSKHDPAPMKAVDKWVKTRSSQMLFVYGQNDPWGAEPFVPSGHDSYTFTAPGANHGANIEALSTNAETRAASTVKRWAGVSTAQKTATATAKHVPGLDDYNPALEERPTLAP